MSNLVSVDCETFLIRPGLVAPRLVCMSIASENLVPPLLLDAKQGMSWISTVLRTQPTILVGHNVTYDLSVVCAEDPSLVPVVFNAYLNGRIRDTRIREKLYDIAKGDHRFYRDREDEEGKAKMVRSIYSLDRLVFKHFKHVLKKEGTWRLKYAELRDVPIAKWPEDAKSYAIGDAEWTLKVFKSQEKWGVLADELPQTRYAWALHLISCWGLRTDPVAVEKLKIELEREYAEHKMVLKKCGFVRESGSKNLAVIREAVRVGCLAQGVELPRTAKGAIQTDAEILKILGGTDENVKDKKLKCLSETNKIEKILGTFLPTLVKGTQVPITCSFDSLRDSGRTSCFSPNVQQLPRKGDVRQAFVPRNKYLFVSCDYDTAELRALAQCCLSLLGESKMAEAIWRDEDLHSAFAASLMHISYEEFLLRMQNGDKECEDKRQFSKIANFGYPGGLGATTFVEYAKNFDVYITASEAKFYLEQWHKQWPEMEKYFKMVGGQVGEAEGVMTQLFSNRVRGGVGFTQCANGYFQGLIADLSKSALWRVSEECYIKHDSALYGSRVVAFLHDEIILEALEDRAAVAAKRLQWIMIDEGKRWLPSIPCKATPVLMRRWYKGAKSKQDEQGNLIPVKPVKEQRDGRDVITWVVDVTS